MNIVLPEIGEGVVEATVSFWHTEKGEDVNEGDDLVEMVTDKATFNVPSPTKGQLVDMLFQEGDVVKIGQTIAVIEEEK